MTHSLVKTWGLVERRGKRGDVRYTLSDEGIRYVTHRDRAELPTTPGHLEHGAYHRQRGPQASRGTPHRDVGEADEARRRHHLVPLEAGSGDQGRPKQ